MLILAVPDVQSFSQQLVPSSWPAQAEPQFLAAAGQHFCIQTVPSEELDEVFQCADVDVLLLTLKQRKDETQGERWGADRTVGAAAAAALSGRGAGRMR